MATFVKVNGFVEHLAEKVHKLDTDALTIALTNTDPTTALNANTAAAVLASVTQISYTYCSSRVCAVASSAQASGTYKLCITDLILTASNGAVGPFQWVVLYNDTPTSPADPVIGFYNYGSALTLADGETLTIDFSDASGVLTLA
jgi:hypothetical protein